NSLRFNIEEKDEQQDEDKGEFDSFGLKLDLSQFKAKERNKSPNKFADASNFLNKTYDESNINNNLETHFNNYVQEIPPIDLSRITKGRNNINNIDNSTLCDLSTLSNNKNNLGNNNGRLNTISNFKNISSAQKKAPNTARDMP